MTTLLELVKAAVQRREAPGIEGWGLWVSNDLDGLGELYEVAPSTGCTSETCAHNSHDPAAPTYKWIPKEGLLVELGYDCAQYGEYVFYTLLRDGNEPVFITVKHPHYFHSSAYTIAEEDVPDWALLNLAKDK